MAYIVCHRKKQKAEVFYIKPSKENIKEEKVLYIKECSDCGGQVLEIYRTDIFGDKKPVDRLKAKNIPNFLAQMKIIARETEYVPPKGTMNKSWVHYEGLKRQVNCVTHDGFVVKSRKMPYPPVYIIPQKLASC